MSGGLRRIGFVATLAIALILIVNIVYEPERQRRAADAYGALALTGAIDLYAHSCAECHGAAGEGLGSYPALDQDFVRNRAADDLRRTIANGRYGTEMIAYDYDQGGTLTLPQIDTLVRLIQQDAWAAVAARVDALGLTPDEILVTTANTATGGQAIDYNLALSLFTTNCSECHGESGEGTFDAPQLNNAYVQSMTADRLTTIVSSGVRNTDMAGFVTTLSPDEIGTLVGLLQTWGHPPQAAAAPAEPISLEEGRVSFEAWCAPCHGLQGEGGSIAPSLNDFPSLPADFISSRVRSGSNAMPMFAETDLPPAQLASIIAYAQESIIGSALTQHSGEDVARGDALYQQFCAACHGARGEGTASDGPPLVTIPPFRGSVIVSFTRLGSSLTPGIPPSTVSDADLALIVAYLHSLSK
ncbi:MAG: c-type cytochrome [Anaerolineae bacterium]|nr:c-type cytochrome [Anaerolineae bacterium]